MNKYLQYDSVDFAQEQSFVRWVQKSDDEDEAFWQEWIAKHPEKKQDITKAITLVNQIKFKEEKIAAGTEERVWSKIEAGTTINSSTQKTLSESKSNSGGILIKLASLAAVAAVAIFLLMVNTGNNFDTTVQTQFADVQTVTLPDGSIVQLNSESKLSYNSKNWDTNRILELEGEAFFDVKEGSKFTVNTQNGDVTVLGTSFNIYNREKAFDVHCKTGKVSVTTEKITTVLTPDQSVSVKNKLHNVQKTVKSNESRSNWKNGLYMYTATRVGDVTKELERQFDIKIFISEELKNENYTGSFSTVNIEGALSEVFWPLDLKYNIDGKNVVISK